MALTKVRLLIGAGNFPTERLEGEETVLILLGAGLGKNGFDFRLLHAFTKGDKDVLELGKHHGAVAFLVVELKDFHKVLKGAAVLVLLDGGVDGQEFIQLHLLSLLHLLHAVLLADGKSGVEVECPQAVAQVVGVHCIVTFEVVDGEGELRLLNVASTEVSHGALFGLAGWYTTIRVSINLK